MGKMDKIVIGKIYNLDLGSSAPVTVKPVRILDQNRVVCEYLHSYLGRHEILSIELFKV